MVAGFNCSICGEFHAQLVTDWASKLPDEVWALPVDERLEQVQSNSDLCRWGERHFIRGVLQVPFTDLEGGFGWGIWAEVDRDTFSRYLEIFDSDGRAEPPEKGTIANAMRPYDDAVGREVTIQFQESTKRPEFFMAFEDHCLLAIEQRAGIDLVRYHAIMAILET